jgi:alanyl-tRNA synthetase
MTVKRFWDDPYLCRCDTTVVAVQGREVALAESIIFAFSGGQERDHGTIGGTVVEDARWDAATLWYTLPASHALRPGTAVALAIDWARRYRLMRLHFAAELVLELMMRRLPHAVRIGAHISVDHARIDVAWPESLAPLLPDLTADALRLVLADMPIVTGYSDRAAERRFWQIAGFARVACAGTHVRRTGEVGAITLRRRNVGRHKERIEIRVAPGPAPGDA